MTIDPPVRADGRCHVCLKRRNPELSKRYHGTTLPVLGTGPRKQLVA